METTVVLGAQFGDEGKGKLVDILSSDAHICCRCAGGNNAGHTIVANGVTYDFHSLPSGLVNPRCINLIGTGCVLHVPSFFKELEALERHGLSSTDRIYISDRVHVVLDLHQLVDGLEEVALGEELIGTTKKGIGPTYSTKMARSGVRVADLFDHATLDKKVRRLATLYQRQFGDLLTYDADEELSRLHESAKRLKPYVIDQITLLRSAKGKSTKVLVEGANALMLDIDYGTYPFCTSSSTGVGGVLTGLTLGWQSIKEVIGVVKAYTTRVGSGPFPTELLDDTGDRLQSIGREFGVTTGRPRRCGWLDLVMVAYSNECNQYSSLNLTKLDVLDTFDTISIATSYKLDDELIDYFPASADAVARVKPIYHTMPGWEQPTTGAKSFDELPEKAREYIEFIERSIGVNIKYIGTGPGRENMIVR